MSFPKTLVKAQITSDRISVLFQIMILSCICKQPLIFRSSLWKSLEISLLHGDTCLDFTSNQKDRKKKIEQDFTEDGKLNPLTYYLFKVTSCDLEGESWAHLSGTLGPQWGKSTFSTPTQKIMIAEYVR